MLSHVCLAPYKYFIRTRKNRIDFYFLSYLSAFEGGFEEIIIKFRNGSVNRK
jgi:hypothetical protein